MEITSPKKRNENARDVRDVVRRANICMISISEREKGEDEAEGICTDTTVNSPKETLLNSDKFMLY